MAEALVAQSFSRLDHCCAVCLRHSFSAVRHIGPTCSYVCLEFRTSHVPLGASMASYHADFSPFTCPLLAMDPTKLPREISR